MRSEKLRPALHVIGVASGKGGVGKSVVALNMATAFAALNLRVGIFDADVYGPSIPTMLGIKHPAWTAQWTIARRQRSRELLPPASRYGLTIMSAGFILGEDQPMGISAATIGFMLSQLLSDTAWGDLDVLVVDLPPGTADIHHLLMERLDYSGVILVVTPQPVAHTDAAKALRMFQHAGVRILGGVENMAAAICPNCRAQVNLFAAAADAQTIWHLGVPRLTTLAVNSEYDTAAGLREPLVHRRPDAPEATPLFDLANSLRRILQF